VLRGPQQEGEGRTRFDQQKEHSGLEGVTVVLDSIDGFRMTNWRYVSLIGLATLLAGCKPTASVSTAADASPAPTTTAVAKRQNLTGYRFFAGTLVIPSAAQAIAYSPYDTPIVSVLATNGKYVERGEPIVMLTIPGADQATSQAKMNSTVANAALSDQKNLASAPVKAAQQALKDAQDAEKAAQDTVASGGTADVAAATQTRIDAQTALAQAQQQMQQTLEPAKQVATASAAQLEAAKADAAQGIVRAPISGTIVALNAKPGMEATSKQEMAMVIDFSAARVQAMLPPDLRGVITKGSKVIVAMEGPSLEPVDGRVLSVKVTPPATGDQGQGYLADIRLTNPRSMAQPSRTVRRVGIKIGEVKNVVVVPVGAVVSQGSSSTARVQKGSDWVSTPVVTGLSDGTLIEIKSGLSEGDVVQVTPAS